MASLLDRVSAGAAGVSGAAGAGIEDGEADGIAAGFAEGTETEGREPGFSLSSSFRSGFWGFSAGLGGSGAGTAAGAATWGAGSVTGAGCMPPQAAAKATEPTTIIRRTAAYANPSSPTANRSRFSATNRLKGTLFHPSGWSKDGIGGHPGTENHS
jgi:hypothetical protein